MPIWSCGGCGLPWPCQTRKRELRAGFADPPRSSTSGGAILPGRPQVGRPGVSLGGWPAYS
ncbi:hypothetical protein DLJ58_03505 [Micromonospora arida]|uniref:Uncharacterized protein n=1 Tax=Micromonospora arida TaxID=2203715 RepID=A0A3N9XL05_9ACTN|nr:hypothetical protein DLJ58_03505 [Micromonospora arida]